MAEKLNPMNLDDFHNYSKKHLPKIVYNYYAHGANNNENVAENLKSYLKYRIRPRIMRDVSKIDTSVKIFGQVLPIPVGISPVAMQNMAHFTGEIGMAKGASMAHTLMIVSNFCTSNIEDIARQNPNAFLMFQLYLQDIDITKNMIRTAEKCNFKGIVLTMNSADDERHNSDDENNFLLTKSFKMRNVAEVEEDDDNNINHNDDDDTRSTITNISSATIHTIPLSESINENLNQEIELDSHITWNTIRELKSLTKLPIIIKGILTEEDAKLAVENGADGIIVSNDGSRQSDTVCTTLEALPEVAKAVNKKIPVFLDGGIRRGSDIFKAIALGADAVFVGRPAIWALNAMGADGVKKMMDILTEEFRLTMAIAGCTRVDQISPKHIQHKMTYISKL